MSVEAFWAVVFVSAGGVGGGVVVLETGRVFGGDSGFFYKGHYEVDRGRISVNVACERFLADTPSVFGDFDTFTLEVAGNLTESDTLNLHGHMTDDPARQIDIQLRRLSDLP